MDCLFFFSSTYFSTLFVVHIHIWLCTELKKYREKKPRENGYGTRTSTVNRLRSLFELNIFSCEYEFFGLTTILNSNWMFVWVCAVVAVVYVCVLCRCMCTSGFILYTWSEKILREWQKEIEECNQMHFSRYRTKTNGERREKYKHTYTHICDWNGKEIDVIMVKHIAAVESKTTVRSFSFNATKWVWKMWTVNIHIH